MEHKVDDIIGLYIKLRAKKDAIENKAKEDVKDIKAKLETLSQWIMAKADQDGVTSFKSKSGTAFVTTVDFANVADWDAVLDFIKTNDAYDMLERRISKTAVRGYIEAHKEVPAGVTYGTKIEVNVRKPTAKAED